MGWKGNFIRTAKFLGLQDALSDLPRNVFVVFGGSASVDHVLILCGDFGFGGHCNFASVDVYVDTVYTNCFTPNLRAVWWLLSLSFRPVLHGSRVCLVLSQAQQGL